MSECIGNDCDHISHTKASSLFVGTDEKNGREIKSDAELILESTQNGKTWNQARFKKPCEYCKEDMIISIGQEARFHGKCRRLGRKNKIKT